jgi:hypothetical protein
MKQWKALAIIFSLGATQVLAASDAPRLVLQITIDGLRGDLLDRYANNFGKGGFNYLSQKGVVYTNAHYLHANTETIVGHTTLATGATPAVHGMVGNVWYHADSGELGYNIEDAEAPLIPTREESIEGAQVDPAQKRARSSGRSPRGILAPTFSDTLKIATAGKAKIFGISGKDRSAVAMAGQTGAAYWYSTDSGDFQSSTYYKEKYPAWVNSWNSQRQAEKLGGKQWQLLLDPGRYQPGRRDDRPYEVDLKGYGRTFPHPFGPANHPLFFTRVLLSPEGDRLLLDFAKALIEAEQVGQDEVTDYLYLDEDVIASKGLGRPAVAAALATELAKTPGIGGAITAADTMRGNPTGAAAAVKYNHHPQRSGDIYIYQQPYWFMFDRGPIAAMHGSPWSYDSHVPIIFAGPGIAPGRVDRLVHPIDVAPTLSALLQLSPPAAAQGSALTEVISCWRRTTTCP